MQPEVADEPTEAPLAEDKKTAKRTSERKRTLSGVAAKKLKVAAPQKSSVSGM